MTQAELAEACGVSRSQISRIESGWGNARIGTISRMLRALSCSLALVMEDPDGFDLDRYLQELRERTEQ